jgi:hypothetical protein
MAKDGKLKVPKRVAGLKVPKKVRKTANKALKLADNPLAMELAAAALAAAAASMKSRNGTAKAATAGAEDQLEAVREQAGRLRDLIVAAALDGAKRLMDGVDVQPAEEALPSSKPQKASGGRRKPADGPPDA